LPSVVTVRLIVRVVCACLCVKRWRIVAKRPCGSSCFFWFLPRDDMCYICPVSVRLYVCLSGRHKSRVLSNPSRTEYNITLKVGSAVWKACNMSVLQHYQNRLRGPKYIVVKTSGWWLATTWQRDLGPWRRWGSHITPMWRRVVWRVVAYNSRRKVVGCQRRPLCVCVCVCVCVWFCCRSIIAAATTWLTCST